MRIETKILNLSDIELNKGQLQGVPENPRLIKDNDYKDLLKSLRDFPLMLNIRELAVVPFGNKYVVVGGNMRYHGLSELGIKETQCKILIDFPAEKIREFTLKDNKGYGQHDWDILANKWNENEYRNWGVDLPIDWSDETETEKEEKQTEQKEKICPHCGKDINV